MCASVIDLCCIKDVREADPNNMDKHDFSIELITDDNVVYVVGQKEILF